MHLLTYLNQTSFLFEYTALFPNLDSISILGSWTVLFLIITSSVIISQLITNFKKISKKSAIFHILFSIGIILVLIIPYPINKNTTLDYEEISILLPQGNFNKDWLWRQNNTELIFDTYKNLSLNSKHADIIIWPEYALPIDIFEEEHYSQRLKGLSNYLNNTIIVGHITNQFKYHYDCATIFEKGEINQTYHSIEPVIFNEQTLKGNNLTIYEINGIKFGVIICYEELNKEIFKKYKQLEVDAIISLTNEQHIDNSIGKELAKLFIKLRSNEYNLPIIRSTNTGITLITNNKGEIVSIIEENKRTSLYHTLKIFK